MDPAMTQLFGGSIPTAAPLYQKEIVPSLRELERVMAQQSELARKAAARRGSFLDRTARWLGVKKDTVCKGYTRQAMPCKRPAIYGDFCRLHADHGRTPANLAR